jgi:CHAD domain-containing protein
MYALVAVSARLAEQLVAIETGGEDAVHQARTHVRRLRSILSVYKKAFDRGESQRMRLRLKKLGERLGAVRDLEVRARDLADLLGVDTAPDVVDAVEGLIAEARADYDRAHAALLRRLRTRAQRELMADVQHFVARPPLTADGGRHPRRVARKGLRRAIRRVLRSGGDSLEQRHAVRKAARRLRYAAEAVADDFGRDAVRLASAAEAVQDVLGDHRDLVLLAQHLRERSTGRGLSQSATAGVARLAAECERRADGLLDVADETLGRLRETAL